VVSTMRIALAGVLLATPNRKVDVRGLRAMASATRADAVVRVQTAVATVAMDLVYAVVLGLLVAGVLALRAVAQQARLDQVEIAGDLLDATGDEEHALLAEHIVAYRIDGPLFFAAAHRFLHELTDVADISVLILRMSRIVTIDASGALVLKDIIETVQRRGITVYLSGIRDGHHQPLEALDVITRLAAEGRVFTTTPEAIVAARHHLHDSGALADRPLHR
jgi:sulfate permease, SulP family